MLLDPRLETELTMVDLSILLGRGSSFSAAAAPAAVPSSVPAPSPSPSMLDLETCVLGSFIFFD